MTSGQGAVTHGSRNLEEPVPEGASIRLLFTFSGPEKRQGGFREAAVAHARARGYQCTVDYYDIINSMSHDLADQHAFDHLTGHIDSRRYDGSLTSPPCSTFSSARNNPGGPRPLRGHAGRDRYGFKNLFPDEQEKVRLGTLLAVRAADICRRFADLDLPWLAENPPQSEGKPSLFGLDEWVQLIAQASAQRTLVAQCMFGADHGKPTELQGDTTIAQAPSTCTHQPQWWRLPPSGRWIWGAHAPLFGRVLAVPADEWHDELFNFVPPHDAPFLTQATAAYPWKFNMCFWPATSLTERSSPRSGVHSRGRQRSANNWSKSESGRTLWSAPAHCTVVAICPTTLPQEQTARTAPQP